MRTTMILNNRAGSAAAGARTLREQAEKLGWEVREPQRSEDTARAARTAAEAGVARVIAAGGDGTVSRVVQGLMASAQPPTLAVLPLGTGNDFARTLRMPLDLVEACRWLARCACPAGHADVIEVRSEYGVAWALNSVSGGIAHQIRRSMDQDQKRRWGPLAFVFGGFEVASEVPSWDVRMKLDGGEPRLWRDIVSLTVANAKSVGGGFQVAPTADIQDGQFDLVVITTDRLRQLLKVAVRAKLGWTLGSKHVEHIPGSVLELRCPQDFAFTVDGEPFEGQDVRVAVCRGVLPFQAGPGYPRSSPQPPASSSTGKARSGAVR